jgi:hypothetical protein
MISQTYLYYTSETILFHEKMVLLSKRIDFYDRRGITKTPDLFRKNNRLFILNK